MIGFISGYTHEPKRVLLLAGIILLLFTVFYYLFWLFSGKPAIIYSTGQAVEWYYYPYFSIVALTTLGFGDMRPNTNIEFLGCIPAYLACTEALAGYIVLAFFVSVIIIRLRIHPYARIGDWFNEYSNQILGHIPSIYNSKWEGYDKDKENKVKSS